MSVVHFDRHPSSFKLVVAACFGLAATGISLMWLGAVMSTFIGWDVGAAIFIAGTWLSVGSMSASETANHAVREDPTITVSDGIIILASLASIAAEGIILVGHNTGGLITVAVLSVVLSWTLVHTNFALHYARLYYTDKPGGIDFNQADKPSYGDFAYLAFTVGMTYQVSDTVIQTRAIRLTLLRQALISYVFGAVIVASAVNLIAGLAK